MNAPARTTERRSFIVTLSELINRPPVSVSFPYGGRAVKAQ